MNCGNDGEGWIWQGHNSTLEDNTGTAEMPKSVMNAMNQKGDHLNFMVDDTTTPLKACVDLPYYVTTSNDLCGKEVEQYREPYSHVKRRRVLRFESNFLDSSLCNDEIFLRSKEKLDTFEDAISEMTQWVAGFAENSNASSGDDHLDPSFEGWIANCFTDNDLQFKAEDMNAPEASDVQIDISEFCNNSSDYDVNPVEKLPVHSHQNVIFKGRNSCMRTPSKLASSIISPFTFIKPCRADGDMTLDDINQLLVTPKPNKSEQDPAVFFPTSAFSGKPVVGKTKIRTEGGEGSITIVRTRG